MDEIVYPDHNELVQLLERFTRRLRWRDGLALAQGTAWIPLLVALSIHLAGRLLPIQNLIYWMLIPLPIWLLGLLGFILFRPMPKLGVARRIDQELGLRERLGTAYAFSIPIMDRAEKPLTLGQFQADLIQLQWQDALSKARAIDPRRMLPMIWQTRHLAIASVLALSLAIFAFFPNPMDEIIVRREAVAQAAEEQAEEIERLREEVSENDQLSPELQEELLRRLAELAAQLRDNPGDLAEALADLSSVEEALQAQVDPQADLRQTTLETLAVQLNSLAGMETSQVADLSEAAEALNQLAEMIGQMDSAQREELAQALAQMAARAAQAGDPSLAMALANLAGAAQSGDPSSASQAEAASQAGEAFSQAQGQFSDQASLGQVLSRLQESRQALGQAGQGQSVAGAPGQGQGDGSGEGEGEGANNGDGAGEGQGQGQGQPGGGGGTTANTLPPATSSGVAGRPQGEGQSGGVTDIGEQIYAPWERGPDNGDELFIPGQDTEQGDTQVRERTDPLPGTANPALMPYYEVYHTYFEAANQVIEQSYIPSGLKDYVREYFSSLEP